MLFTNTSTGEERDIDDPETAVRPALDRVTRDSSGQIVTVMPDYYNDKYKGFLTAWVLTSSYKGD